MERSAVPTAPTVVMAMAVLLARLGSVVPEVMLATSTICEPPAVAGATVTTTVKVTTAALAKSGLLQVIEPVPPTAGVTQVQPESAGEMLMEEKVVLAGTDSVKTALMASMGPLLVTTLV